MQFPHIKAVPGDAIIKSSTGRISCCFIDGPRAGTFRLAIDNGYSVDFDVFASSAAAFYGGILSSGMEF